MIDDTLLGDLSKKGITLTLDGDELRVRAPKGSVTPELYERIQKNKPDVVRLLRRQPPPPTKRSLSDAALPLSFGQQRMWFFHQLKTNSAVYNMAFPLRATEPLEIEALERAFGRVQERHASLRTTFKMVEGAPVQEIAPPQAPSIPVERVESEEALRQRLNELANEPFDLSEGPLIRARVVRPPTGGDVLMLVKHHIISDGWSAGILLHELATLYDGYVSGKDVELPELPLEYTDYAAWQRERLNGTELKEQLAYWKGQLDAAPPLLELPSDRPRPPVQNYRGASIRRPLPPALGRKLEEIAKRCDATLFMVALSTFVALLARWSGREDLVIGTPIAGRNHTVLQGLIGFFVNTLALRTDAAGNPSFTTLVERVKKTALDAYEYQDLPFDMLVEELNPDREASYSPVVQVMFALQDPEFVDAPSPSWEPLQRTLDIEATAFDLFWQVQDDEGGLSTVVEFNTDLFDHATVERLAIYYERLLEGITANPETRILELPLLNEEETRRSLVEWNATRTTYPRDSDVVEQFELQVARAPEAVAVSFGEERVSYGQLDRLANQLAHRLIELGVGPEVMVGLCIERSVEMVVGLLGILKAGGAYVPLDPTYPARRIEFMLGDTRTPVLVTLSRLVDALPQQQAKVLCLDTEWPEIATRSEEPPKVELGPNSLAYVIYTSGSTGQPKGACIEHRSVLRLVKETNYLDFGPDEVFLQFAPISFDASTLEIWGALLNGGRLAVYRPGILSLKELGEFIDGEGVTTLWLTAALFHQMVDDQLPRFHRVRQMLSGGDVLSVQHVKRYLEALTDDQRLINGYGPTENTTFSTCYSMTRNTEIGRSVPIGKPIANTTAYILNTVQQPVAVGAEGELYVGGDGIAREYLHQPKLTAERFVDDPFSDEPGARMYRTGDRVRAQADGTIEFLGRVDTQVKVRGYRIELGEIETLLRDNDALAEVAVLAREDDPGDKRLVAYVVPVDGTELSVDALRAELKNQLPDYMVPSAFVVLKALPVTPNGKLDRDALPARERAPGTGPQRPLNKLELQITAIWERVLNLDRIGLYDNFFEIGGNSLKAVRVFSYLSSITGRELPLSTLFQAPTIASLAASLTTEGWQPSWSALVAIRSDGTRTPLFMVPGVGGNVLTFAHLPEYLGEDQPLYGLQSRGLDGEQAPLETVQEIASYFLEDVRKVQPHGPYFLAGVCMGGVVVYEMARQLREAGEAVHFLALIETGFPDALSKTRRKLQSAAFPAKFFLSGLARHAHALWERPIRTWPRYLREKGTIIKEMMQRRDVYRGERRLLYQDSVSTANYNAMAQYVPPQYDGALHLFLAREVETDDDQRLKWAKLASGEHKIYRVPAPDSGALFAAAGVGKFSAVFKQVLDDVAESQRPSETA